jgi:hypothetical protein
MYAIYEQFNIVQHCVMCILLYCVFYYVCEGDTDEDILPYPAPTVRQKKATNGPLKYFVLTSKEAHAAKLQQQQDKVQREKEKMERTKLRAENAIKRAEVKKEKAAAAEERKLKRTILPKNGKTPKRVRLADAAATGLDLPAETSLDIQLESSNQQSAELSATVPHADNSSVKSLVEAKQLGNRGNQDNSKLPRLPVTNVSKSKRAKPATDSADKNELATVDNTPCSYCEILYSQSDVGWYECSVCKKWACGKCACMGRKRIFTCHNCK